MDTAPQMTHYTFKLEVVYTLIKVEYHINENPLKIREKKHILLKG